MPVRTELVQIIFLLTVFIQLIACQTSEKRHVSVVMEFDTVPPHPRILWTQNEELEINRLLAESPSWDSIHQLILHECEKIIKKPPVEFELEGMRLLEVSREFRKRVFYLTYAWRITRDEKYRARAEQELLTVSSFENWNPSHFLDVAEITMGMAIGYDWLYNSLSQSSRTQIMDAIIKKGLEPSLRKENNKWVNWNNNWNQVCNAGMAFGALAVYEDEPALAQQILSRSIESIKLAMKQYAPGGAYPEGYDYWTYGTTFNVYLISALEKCFGSDFGLMEEPGFMKTASYLLNMVGPTGKVFNYSDGSERGMLNPAMFWFAIRLQENSLLFSEKIFLTNKKRLSGMRELPALLIWGVGVNEQNISEPTDLIWVGDENNAVAMMRSSWKPNAIYVGLKAGSPEYGHGHMDVGSFIMDALGERWAMDFGGQDYFSLESKGINLWSLDQNSDRWKVFRYNNLAHNTLTFNNTFQEVKEKSPIIRHNRDKSFLSAIVDLTKTYKKFVLKAWRGVAVVDGKYVVIRDEIETNANSSTMRWTLLTSAKVNIINETTAELTLNNKRLTLRFEGDANATLTTWSTQADTDYDAPNPGTTFVGFVAELSPHTQYTFSVVLIPETGKKINLGKIENLNHWIP